MSVPSTIRRSFFKDVQQLYQTIDASTDGQAAVESLDDMSVVISLRPKTGFNAHATFLMTINCPPGYPVNVPGVKFDTPIFHPNIDGGVCLSIFSEWQTCYSLLDIVKAILYLIDHPNFESDPNDYTGAEGQLKLATKSARLLAGLPVNGIRFPPNASWCEWARANNCLPTEEEESDSYVWTPPTEIADAASITAKDASEQTAIVAPQIVESEYCGESLPDPWSDDFSDTIRSFVKPRLSFLDSNFEDCSRSYSQYYPLYSRFEIGTHRIIVWQPTCEDTMGVKSLFYYAEVLCANKHFKELGLNYSNLFKGSLIHETQVKSEFRQSSKACMWTPYLEDSLSHQSFEFSSSRNFNLNLLFADEKPQKNLTSDFCPWSKEDGLGIHDLFGTLFFNDDKPRTDFTCFLDKDSASNATSVGIAGFFNSENADSIEEIDYRLDYYLDADSIAEQSVSVLTSYSDPYLDEKNSSEVAPTYSDRAESCHHPMKLCFDCNSAFDHVPVIINENLSGDWGWEFRQTRWPIRFAPQQSVELTVADVLIPPWRVSAGRLLHDVNQYCAKNREVKNLVLLDPMSVSPLSPLLNLMRKSTTPSRRLTGVLWMTPLQALSPNFHVPIPIEPEGENDDIDDATGVGKVHRYPSAFTLRFLTLDAYLTNLASWISRIEVYSALGFSRSLSKYATDAMAASVLQPHSLGCGEAPTVDLWPLWLLRNILKLSLHLPQLSTSLLCLIGFEQRRPATNIRFFFPFTDIDEI